LGSILVWPPYARYFDGSRDLRQARDLAHMPKSEMQ
jgi:hypothetical protein